MAKKLVMTFLDDINKKMSISIDDPREDITSEEVRKVMDDIVTKNIFTSKGVDIVKIEGAKVVETTVTEFEYKG